MHFKIHIDLDKIENLLLIFLISAVTIFSTYTWGKYILIICILCIIVVNVLQNNFKYYIAVPKHFVIMGLFICYTFVSSLWAESASDAIAKGVTLLEVFLMAFVIYNSYRHKANGVKSILNVIKVSSYVIVLYSILFYGIDNLAKMVTSAERLQNSYANVNSIGMLAAIGILIQIDQMFNDKKIKMDSILMLPSIFMIAATQSRKALVVLVAGSLFLLILYNMSSSKNIINSILKVLVSVVAGLLLIYLVLSLPMFSGIMERMMKLIIGIVETGEVGASAETRFNMLQIGWNQFVKTPLVGIGMGCSHFITMRELGHDTYLHNNFIELLASGGIIGFSIYYSLYVFLFIDYWKYRKYKDRNYYICLVMMIMLLIMDYGMVSYISKLQYIYIMLYFLEVEALKQKISCVRGNNI